MQVSKQICKECPFRTNSAPGWLGPHLVAHFISFMDSEYPVPCHLHLSKEVISDVWLHGDKYFPVCRGYIACANKSNVIFGKTKDGLLLRQLQLKVGPEDVLDRNEFRRHHSIFEGDESE